MNLYINGSPKLEASNSSFFLNEIKNHEPIKYLYRDKLSNILNNINKVDTIILSFPLYVDSPPNKVIELMEYIENNNINIENINIYTIINCGFWEAKQNITASSIIKNFCKNNNANYKGTFNIGAGEIIGKRNKVPLYKLISINYKIKMRKFKRSIINKKEVYLNTTIHPMTKRLYNTFANINWQKKMK